MSQELDLIIDSTHDGIVAVDRDGRITLFNRAAEAISGRNAEEVTGRHVRDIIPDSRLPEVLETGLPELNQQQPYRDTTIVTSRIPLRDDRGVVIGAFAVFRDISDAVASAEEITNLREMRIMWRAIFESTQDAISVVDERGFQVSVNPAYTQVTGLPESEVIGKHCTIDIAAGESIHLRVLKERRPVRGARIRVGPTAKEVLVDAAPIIVDGTVKGSVAVIKDLTEILRLNSELNHAQTMIRKLQAKYTFDDLIGRHPTFVSAIRKAQMAATTPATVLLQGESGTGKELFAHAIHNASDRRHQKFVRLNCASLSESVLESELFGYVEGAFTGARKGGKVGLFEEADGGTIFLDEIGLMSLNTQAKLLRVLQEHEVRRVGGTSTIAIDARVIAATNLDLGVAIQQGQFREDLFYRLNVIPIQIPPLRRRKEDMPRLIDHLIARINQEYGRAVSAISPEAVQRLLRYSWPGNIRELENVLKRAIINLTVYETVISELHLPELTEDCEDPAFDEEGCRESDTVDPKDLAQLHEVVDSAEAAHVARALAATRGNRTAAARLLGVSLRTLQYKIKKHAIL
ncbi:MAG: sigma 54-interacting transcriptional regulator [Spirochaetota bacterium]